MPIARRKEIAIKSRPVETENRYRNAGEKKPLHHCGWTETCNALAGG